MKPHQKLDVWRKSISFVKQIYELTGSYPAEEKFGLVSQMRRAAISIPSNISEGAARSSRKEFIHFLYVSQGSVSEIETQIIISKELSFIAPALAESILNDLEIYLR